MTTPQRPRAGARPAGLAALIVLIAACSGGPASSTMTPGSGAGPAPPANAGARPAKVDPCASGGAQVILAARVGVGLRDRAPETWVDFEVRGRELDAQRFCEAIVQRELATVYPAETRLVARVERPCLATAMAEPKGTPPYLLAERRPIDGLEAMMRGLDDAGGQPPRGGEKRPACASGSAGVNATERRLTGYPDKASCEKAQREILGRRAQSDADAKAKAAEWLADTIAEQEKQMAEACSAPRSAPCIEQKELVRLLKSRAAKASGDAQPDQSSSESPATWIGAPICRPR